MANVAFVRPEVSDMLPLYAETSDCIDGSAKVKSKKEKYLPKPNAADMSLENTARYNAYLNRAIFYNVTKATYGGLVGQIFAKPPVIEIPDILKPLEANADGKGSSLIQMSKDCSGLLLKHSRIGLLSDYPVTDKELSATEIEEMNIRPTIKVYESPSIINWRTKEIGAEVVYSLIVLKEKVIYEDDGFEFKEQYRYKVLTLSDDNVYRVDIYDTSDGALKKNAIYSISESYIPTTFSGETLNRIPFVFAGSDNNDAMPDIPVLYDIAVLNLGHYRNSADYEESCFIVGQPTPWFSGLTEEWVKEVLNGVVQLGSRAAVPLPVGGSAGLLQANPNVMPMEAMKHKEAQFVSLGAKLVTVEGVQKTATESNIDNATETSILSSIANNLSEAFETALKNCAKFLNPSESEIKFEVNSDFQISKMSVAERSQLLKEWMSEAISFTEYRNNLREGKIDILDDEDARGEIETAVLDGFKVEEQNPANKVIPSVGK